MVRLLFILIICIFSTFSYAADKKKITIVADEWCPYNCIPNSDREGYMVDIAKEVFKEYNIKIEYILTPWARSIKLVEDGISNGVIGATKDEVPHFVFPEEHQGVASLYFYIRADDDWHYKDITSLSKKILGVIRDYGYGKSLDPYIEANKNNNTLVQLASSEDALGTNIKKLLKKRIDITAEDKSVLNNYLKENNLQDKVKEAGSLLDTIIPSEDYLYIAFSPEIKESKKYAKILSEGVKKLRDNNRLNEILDKYGLKDWKLEKYKIKGEE